MIEVLVVLALVALVVAIAIPEFAKVYARVRLSFERQDLARQLSELPQKVRAAGHGGVLLDPATERSTAAAALARLDPLEAWRPLSLDLPSGWHIEVPKPIYYHFTGACDGGVVIFSLSPFSLRYVLRPPLCRPEETNAAAP